jgi:hypothetical protein
MARRTGGLLVAVLVLALGVGSGTALAQLGGQERDVGVEADLSAELAGDAGACEQDLAVATIGVPAAASGSAVVGSLDPFVPEPSDDCGEPDDRKVDLTVSARIIGNTFNVSDVTPKDPPVGITKLGNLKQTDGKPAKGFLATNVLKNDKATVTIEGGADTNFNGKAGSTKVRITISIDASDPDPKKWKTTMQVVDLNK